MSSEMARFQTWWRTFSEANPLAGPQQAAAAAWQAAPVPHPGRFSFRLRCAGHQLTAGEYQVLEQAGAADAEISSGPDGTTLEFTREGRALAAAVDTAVQQVRKAGLDPILEVEL
jgi:hypothetical protein